MEQYDDYANERFSGHEVPVNCDRVMNVTTLNDLRHYNEGVLVRFPDFAYGQPFVARVRRPSLLQMVSEGKIPNNLIIIANEIFNDGGNKIDKTDKDLLKKMFELTEVIAEATLVSPSLSEIKEAGITLTDEQLMALFSYCQVGVKSLESFRQEQKNNIVD